MRVIRILAACALLCAGASPAQTQRELVKRLTDKVYHSRVKFDEDGNLISLVVRHKNLYRRDQPEKPGLNNEDMRALLAFPKLRSLEIWNVPVDAEGLKVLPKLPALEELELRELYQRVEIKPGFLLFLNDMPRLKILDLMHWFGLDSYGLDDLTGLPNLEVLNVDKPAAHMKLVNFVAKCPKIKVLGLHRVPLTEDEFLKLVEVAPNLEALLMRHTFRGRKGSRRHWQALRLMRRAPKLKLLNLGDDYAPPYVWEDGLEHLVDMPQLKVLIVRGHKLDDPALKAFAEKRPQIDLSQKRFPWDP